MNRRSCLLAPLARPAPSSAPWRRRSAFCGFYVAKAGSDLFNRSSRVVLARDGDRTVLTMENDYRGDPAEFAMVVPVPTILAREQIHVGDRAMLDHLDAFTSPRLVEYFDPTRAPCRSAWRRKAPCRLDVEARDAACRPSAAANGLGVRIEAKYSVGEYEILILSAKESEGLETWLRTNGYSVPAGAAGRPAQLPAPGALLLRRQGRTSSASASSASRACARCRWRTRARASCCPSASAW